MSKNRKKENREREREREDEGDDDKLDGIAELMGLPIAMRVTIYDNSGLSSPKGGFENLERER